MPRLPEEFHHGWKGTPPLTRRVSSLGEERLFLVGDAAGYVEPFTGEGMTWALIAARTVAPLAVTAARRAPWDASHETNWSTAHRALQRRMRSCGRTTRLLRRPLATRLAVRILAVFPWLAARSVRDACDPGQGAGRPVACGDR